MPMMRPLRHAALMLFAALLLVPGAPRAASLFLSPSLFGGTESIVTFEEGSLPVSGPFTSVGGVGFLLLDTDTNDSTGFGPTIANDGSGVFAREFGPSSGRFLNMISVQTGDFFNDLRITLPSMVLAIAMEIRSGQPGNDVDDLTFELYAGATAIATLTTPIRGQTNFLFYGIESDTAFDTLVIRQRPDARFGIDNLRYGNPGAQPVPEPGALALFAGALGLLGAARRRVRPA
jgi:hypothetical protein